MSFPFAENGSASSVTAPNVAPVPAMDCAAEESEIRRAVEGIPGLVGLRFQLGERSLRIDGDPQAAIAAVEAIRNSGFEIHPWPAAPASTQDGDAAAHDHDAKTGTGLPRLLAALALAIAAEGLSFFVPDAPWSRPAGLAIAAAAIALAGFGTFRKGLTALRHGRLNINALMSVAVAGAFVIGQWPEAAMVMALYAIAELIEARAVDRARNAIKSLLELSPEQAEVLQPNGSWLQVLAKDIQVGQIVRVRPGERFALDGNVTTGNSAVDQSPVTGESMPIEKGPGDEVFAGTINQSAALEFEVTAPASDTVLARIIHAVEEAQGSRAPTQRFVDRFAAIYTPGVFVLALGVALVGPLALDWTWMASLYKALVMLVIACPCALVISTPVPVVSGLAAAARRGILIKGGAYLEEARKLKAVALDKTGTVTEGRPKLVAQVVISQVLPESEVVRIASALAARSDHPVSKAVATGLALPEQMDVQDFGAEAGRGVFGTIAGHDYVLGNHRWIHDRGQCSPELEASLFEHERQGRTVAVLANQETVLAMFAVADTIKASSQEAIGEMLKLGVTPVMLTGDNPATASSIAAQAGITDVRANLLPEEKLDSIRALASVGDPVAMVGDGINDAPALATADIGFAMGSAGTHTAMEAADVVIMNDDLRRVPETIRLSIQTHSVLWQNITLALGIKFVFLLLALFDHATMWMAVFADMGASLLVVANGLRLLRK